MLGIFRLESSFLALTFERPREFQFFSLLLMVFSPRITPPPQRRGTPYLPNYSCFSFMPFSVLTFRTFSKEKELVGVNRAVAFYLLACARRTGTVFISIYCSRKVRPFPQRHHAKSFRSASLGRPED